MKCHNNCLHAESILMRDASCREIATGIARLVVFVQQTESKALQTTFGDEKGYCLLNDPSDYIQVADGIGVLTTMMFWAMIEMGIAIVAGCLPTIWPLISKVSLEGFVRSVLRALSLERLRASLGRAPARNISQPSDKLNWTLEDAGPYQNFSNQTSRYGPEGFIGVDRSIEVKRSLAEDKQTQQSYCVCDPGVRTVTHIYSGDRGGDIV